jgi:hypothetical protein
MHEATKASNVEGLHKNRSCKTWHASVISLGA